MTPRVKKIIKNYLESFDNKDYDLKFVKGCITYLSYLEEKNLLDKFLIIYPLGFSNKPMIISENYNKKTTI